MKTQQELIDDLKALGFSSTEIYSSLLSQGCKGENHHARCPIAMYLKNKGYESPSVDDDCISSENVDFGWMGGICPEPPIRSFIRDFDSGLYPDLDYRTIQTEST